MSNFTVGESYSIEHLGWTARLSFLAYGLRIAVRVNDANVLGLVPRCLPCGSKPSQTRKVDRLYSLLASERQGSPKRRQRYVLFDGSRCVSKSLNLGELLNALEREARLFVAEHARR